LPAHDMTSNDLIIRLQHPRGNRWERLLWEPDVKRQIDKVARSMDLPTSRIVITLNDHVTLEQAEELAEQVRALLEGGTVRVEHRS
jgi:hypothetical protein